MSLIEVKDLSFQYENSYLPVFEHVSFQIDTKYRLGLVGRNGKGKTTFLKLLLRELDDRGAIHFKGKASYFPYTIANEEEMLALLVYELEEDIEYWKFLKEFHLLGLKDELLERPYASLSGGEKTKFQLACLFASDTDYLLIDEPTDHLDQKGRQDLAEYLKKKDGFLLVSHDRYFLDETIDHVLSFDKAKIEVLNGNFSSWYENHRYQEERELSENERLKKEINRLNASVKKNENWSNAVERSKIGAADKGFVGHMAAKAMKRAKNIERRKLEAIEEKKELLKNVEEMEPLSLFPLKYPKDRLIAFDHFTVSYVTPLFEELIGEITQGKHVLLEGENGAGKSSFIKVMLGERIPYLGDLYRGSNLKISYIPQDVSYLCGSLDAYIEKEGLDPVRMRATLRKLGFPRELFLVDMKQYSMGQKKKVAIASSLCTGAHLYIWDEPLNYVDVFSRMMMEELLKESDATILVVEHDKRFIEGIMDYAIHLKKCK